MYLVGLHRPFIFTEPYFGVERKTKEESGAYLFEISHVCLEGKTARLLVIKAMAEYAAKCLSCQGILHRLAETGVILYVRSFLWRWALLRMPWRERLPEHSEGQLYVCEKQERMNTEEGTGKRILFARNSTRTAHLVRRYIYSCCR